MLKELKDAGLPANGDELSPASTGAWANVHALVDILKKLPPSEIATLDSAKLVDAMAKAGPINRPEIAPFDFTATAFPDIASLSRSASTPEQAMVTRVENGKYVRVSQPSVTQRSRSNSRTERARRDRVPQPDHAEVRPPRDGNRRAHRARRTVDSSSSTGCRASSTSPPLRSVRSARSSATRLRDDHGWPAPLALTAGLAVGVALGMFTYAVMAVLRETSLLSRVDRDARAAECRAERDARHLDQPAQRADVAAARSLDRHRRRPSHLAGPSDPDRRRPRACGRIACASTAARCSGSRRQRSPRTDASRRSHDGHRTGSSSSTIVIAGFLSALAAILLAPIVGTERDGPVDRRPSRAGCRARRTVLLVRRSPSSPRS